MGLPDVNTYLYPSMRTITTILTVTLLLGFVAERMLPCSGLIDLCRGDRGVATMVVEGELDTDDHHTHDNGTTGDHHDECSDCICPCHAPIPPVERTGLEVVDIFSDYPPAPTLLPIVTGAEPPSPIPLV